MDGFAVKHEALSQGIQEFVEVGQQWAGSGQEFEQQLDACVRITTGAPIPMGFDTVVIKENTSPSNNKIKLTQSSLPMRGSHVRLAGEDLAAGEVFLEKNTKLNPLHVSLAATQGLSELTCYKKPTVALLTTGDEIIPPGQTLQTGQIYDSNRSLLQSLLHQQFIESVAWPIVRDDPQALHSALTDLSESFDLIITSGGVSAGEKDYLPQLLRQHGDIYFWKVLIKPGMPVLFGRMNQCLIMSLPGNPVSVFATFTALVMPLLNAMQGLQELSTWRKARLINPINKSHSRLEFMRGRLSIDKVGQCVVHADSATGSHRITSAAKNNALILLPDGEANFAAGDSVDVYLFEGADANQ
jgi:molybdopterin molybdotransferase